MSNTRDEFTLTKRHETTVNKNHRPVNLDISTFSLPITAYVSIMHRISGCVLLVGIVVLMWMLDQIISSPHTYNDLMTLLDQLWFKLVLWAIMSALAYHIVAGARHLLMDMGIGESLQGGRTGAKLLLVAATISIAALGGWILW